MAMRLLWKPKTEVLVSLITKIQHGFRVGAIKPAFRLPWRRLAAGFCLALVISAAVMVAILVNHGIADQQSLARINGPLPPLMVDSSGVSVNLNQFTAKRRCVVVFYSPSCGVCREVLPALKPFPPTLQLIMISESNQGSQLSGFHEDAFYYDRWGSLSRFFTVPTLPVILLVDEGGIIREGLVGSHKKDWIRQKLNLFASGES